MEEEEEERQGAPGEMTFPLYSRQAGRQAGYRVDDDLSEFSRFALMVVVVKKKKWVAKTAHRS